jgi:hypothetical protein
VQRDWPVSSNQAPAISVSATLLDLYGPHHEIFIYEVAHYPVCRPVIKKVPVAEMTHSQVTGISMLCIPPLREPQLDPAMLTRLGLA